MSLILRYCILSQRKQYMQKCVQYYNNSSYIKKFGPVLYIRYFSEQNDQNSDREVIYKGSLTNRVRNLKMVSFLTTIGALCMQPYIYIKSMEDDNLASLAVVFTCIALPVIFSPILVNLLAKRYVIQMYYIPKDNTYIAETFNFFCLRKQIIFTKDDVYVSQMGGMLSSCKIKSYPVLFVEKDFIEPEHFFILLGYKDSVDKD